MGIDKEDFDNSAAKFLKEGSNREYTFQRNFFDPYKAKLISFQQINQTDFLHAIKFFKNIDVCPKLQTIFPVNTTVDEHIPALKDTKTTLIVWVNALRQAFLDANNVFSEGIKAAAITLIKPKTQEAAPEPEAPQEQQPAQPEAPQGQPQLTAEKIAEFLTTQNFYDKKQPNFEKITTQKEKFDTTASEFFKNNKNKEDDFRTTYFKPAAGKLISLDQINAQAFTNFVNFFKNIDACQKLKEIFKMNMIIDTFVSGLENTNTTFIAWINALRQAYKTTKNEFPQGTKNAAVARIKKKLQQQPQQASNTLQQLQRSLMALKNKLAQLAGELQDLLPRKPRKI
ncbi:hypothetical protein K2X40_03050 [Candidatus Babeliales bacterium]|nr:hypothetical protein [Candidatus Babeliales bacterium]